MWAKIRLEAITMKINAIKLKQDIKNLPSQMGLVKIEDVNKLIDEMIKKEISGSDDEKELK